MVYWHYGLVSRFERFTSTAELNFKQIFHIVISWTSLELQKYISQVEVLWSL